MLCDVSIMLHLKKAKSMGRDYLSIVSSYWDRECK